MFVIPSTHRQRNEEPARQAQIHGTFQSPSGGFGTMAGSLRLERFHVISDRLYADGVFTGELVGSDGTNIGVGSRRRTVPAEIALSLHGMAVVIGPVDVDLLGLTVSIPAFTMDTGVVGPTPFTRTHRRSSESTPMPGACPEGAEVYVQWPQGNRSVG